MICGRCVGHTVPSKPHQPSHLLCSVCLIYQQKFKHITQHANETAKKNGVHIAGESCTRQQTFMSNHHKQFIDGASRKQTNKIHTHIRQWTQVGKKEIQTHRTLRTIIKKRRHSCVLHSKKEQPSQVQKTYRIFPTIKSKKKSRRRTICSLDVFVPFCDLCMLSLRVLTVFCSKELRNQQDLSF